MARRRPLFCRGVKNQIRCRSIHAGGISHRPSSGRSDRSELQRRLRRRGGRSSATAFCAGVRPRARSLPAVKPEGGLRLQAGHPKHDRSHTRSRSILPSPFLEDSFCRTEATEHGWTGTRDAVLRRVRPKLAGRVKVGSATRDPERLTPHVPAPPPPLLLC